MTPSLSGCSEPHPRLSLRSSQELELWLPATAASLRLIRRRLKLWLGGLGATSGEINDITLACNEACTNAIEHAYRDRRPGDFLLHAVVVGRTVEINVRDWGRWQAPRPGDRGRGIGLMADLLDSADVFPEDEGTSIRMRRALQQ